MGKLIFALVLSALGIGASRALASMAAAPSGPWQRAAPHLRLASRVALAIGVVIPTLVVLFSTFYESVIIDPAAQEVLKATTALHNAAEILQRRPVMKAEVQKEITAWLVKYGVEMKEAALANIRFDPAYEKAIEFKQIEEQKAEQKRYELVQAQRQAEIVAAEAKGVADALRIKGEANYNGRLSSSLTPVLIQQQYLSRWDGRLPQ